MMRSGYTAPCRFFRDSDTVDEIEWYRCQPGVPELGYESAITPLRWRPCPWLAEGVGEVFDRPQPFDQGVPRVGADGGHVCGTEDDFRDGGLYLPDEPPVEYAGDGLPLCCRPAPGAVVLGGTSPLIVTGSTRIGGSMPYALGSSVPGGGTFLVTVGVWYQTFVPIGNLEWWFKTGFLAGGEYHVEYQQGWPDDSPPISGSVRSQSPGGTTTLLALITNRSGCVTVTIPDGYRFLFGWQHYQVVVTSITFRINPGIC